MALAIRHLVKAKVYDPTGKVALRRFMSDVLPKAYLEAALGDTTRVATNIYGPYVGRAVPWKRNPGARPEGVRKINEMFANVAHGCKGAKGFKVIVNRKGEKVVVTGAAACIAEQMRGKRVKV